MKPNPYAYPSGPHNRRHGASGWSDYQQYRPWLRDEFTFRCVYCLQREQWADMRRAFQIDHFIPQKIRPDLKADYDNLIYLCPNCNSLKSATLLPDPCKVDLRTCLKFLKNGEVKALNKSGERIILVLDLNRSALVDHRRSRIGVLKTLYVHNQSEFKEMMRFPKDLPDLTQKPPKKNTRPKGVDSSWFAKREKGKLPEVY
tara:strand:- start:69 stop:671 length:603 start_codon:yes stop_codon:yes gene_type:complete